MKKPKILVNLKTYQRKWQIDPAAVRRYLNKVWNMLVSRADISVPIQTEISIVFLNQEKMQQYNKEYRKKDYPTDVLSFPVNELTKEQQHYLGDILLCTDKAWENARTSGHSIDHELQVLMLHGVLHLLGYDHERDTGEMEALEKQLRKRLVDNTRVTRTRVGSTQP